MLVLSDLVDFEKMVTPSILNVFYWLSIIGIVLAGGCIVFLAQYDHDWYVKVVTGVGIIILGPIVIRVFYELSLLPFRSYDKLCEISDLLKSNQ